MKEHKVTRADHFVVLLMIITSCLGGYYVQDFAINAKTMISGRETLGYYMWGKIILYPALHINMDEYLDTATHEYGHYIYNKIYTRADRLRWTQLVEECGFESGYDFASVYRQKSKVDEEFAECYKHERNNESTCCEQKRSMIKEVLN